MTADKTAVIPQRENSTQPIESPVCSVLSPPVLSADKTTVCSVSSLSPFRGKCDKTEQTARTYRLNRYLSKPSEIEEAKKIADALLTLEFATPFQLRPGERVVACRKFRNALRADLLTGQHTARFRPALELARLLLEKTEAHRKEQETLP